MTMIIRNMRMAMNIRNIWMAMSIRNMWMTMRNVSLETARESAVHKRKRIQIRTMEKIIMLITRITSMMVMTT